MCKSLDSRGFAKTHHRVLKGSALKINRKSCGNCYFDRARHRRERLDVGAIMDGLMCSGRKIASAAARECFFVVIYRAYARSPHFFLALGTSHDRISQCGSCGYVQIA